MEDANEIRAMFNHFSPQNLYKKINSSYEQAMSDSLKLI
jgi:predicted component of type VI protein secretion system